jgi:hypothetical protein
MGIQVEGIDQLRVLLTQGGQKAVRGVIEQMRKEATAIKDKAQEMAPLEFGNLEQAIKMREVGGGRNSFGQFSRKSFEVYVDGEMPVPERPGKRVSDYAWEVHQHLTPYGMKKLGEWSQAKQSTSNEVVGGGFMERAVAKVTDKMMGRLIDAANRAL